MSSEPQPISAAPPFAGSDAWPSDPARVIEQSRVQRIGLPGWPLLVVGTILLVWALAPSGGPVAVTLGAAGPLLLLGLWVALSIFRGRLAVRVQAEADAVVALDELIQLRRWTEAVELAHRLLGRPMLVPERRLAALMNYSTLLARYHRFDDALVIHDYLLKPEPGMPQPDGPTAHAIRVARAMAMLRADHLVDADRAMSDLRRDVNRARDEVRRAHGPEAAGKLNSAGLILLDLYRDVKTGHFDEAIQAFDESLPALRDQLGMRVADAWVLAAMARHERGDAVGAAAAYADATTLAPAVELHRRYPETTPLREFYPAAAMPKAVA